MKMNTNSNKYIIIYSVVMVVIVAVLLSLAAVGLKPFQEENILNDNKSQIVKALGEDKPYNEVVAKACLIDDEGKVVEESEAKVFEALKDVKATRAENKYPIFVAKDGSVVVPLIGKGLWDDIWGFVALEPDMNTIKGIVLSHKGETPGLGAEIATPKHQAQYKGKTIFDGDDLVGITLVKGGADKDNLHEVDAISGGTKTSDGVTKMIQTCLASYEPYFKANKQEVEQPAVVEQPSVVAQPEHSASAEDAPAEDAPAEDTTPAEGKPVEGESVEASATVEVVAPVENVPAEVVAPVENVPAEVIAPVEAPATAEVVAPVENAPAEVVAPVEAPESVEPSVEVVVATPESVSNELNAENNGK